MTEEKERAWSERTGVVLLPCGKVEVTERRDLRGDGPPGAAKIKGASAENDLELRAGAQDETDGNKRGSAPLCSAHRIHDRTSLLRDQPCPYDAPASYVSPVRR